MRLLCFKTCCKALKFTNMAAQLPVAQNRRTQGCICMGSRLRLSCFAGIRDAVALHRPKILFLTSPNNPDGSMISEADLQELLQLPVLVVLDEAYIEFSDVPSRMPLVLQQPNLVVLRTFSKSAALAGTPADGLWRAAGCPNGHVEDRV